KTQVEGDTPVLACGARGSRAPRSDSRAHSRESALGRTAGAIQAESVRKSYPSPETEAKQKTEGLASRSGAALSQERRPFSLRRTPPPGLSHLVRRALPAEPHPRGLSRPRRAHRQRRASILRGREILALRTQAAAEPRRALDLDPRRTRTSSATRALKPGYGQMKPSQIMSAPSGDRDEPQSGNGAAGGTPRRNT